MSLNCDPGTFPYIIQPDDTFWDLAGQYNTTIEDIMAANPDVDPDNLLVGQVICLPGEPPSATWMYDQADPPPPRPERRPEPRPEHRPPFRRPPFHPYFRPACPRGRLYTVQPGDNIYRISRRFGVPAGEIISRNRYVNFYYLQVGQVICIPHR
jgi:peptidoglycan endopeptidase LytF